MSHLILYSYWRSSAAYRVRIGLSLKGLEYETRGIDLRLNEHLKSDYRSQNPQGFVPALILDNHVISQSMAILEALDEFFPAEPLLPKAPSERAIVRSMAQIIACDIHPLNNLRVLRKLEGELGFDEDAKKAWMSGWIREGFFALEEMIKLHSNGFAFGDRPGLVDCFLVPQAYNADRFGIDISDFYHCLKVRDACLELNSFALAHPEAQPDCQ
jgi:maleylacetoacetate isomerase